jgi:hypothetical protein
MVGLMVGLLGAKTWKENGVDLSRPLDLVTVTLLGRHLADALAPEARG